MNESSERVSDLKKDVLEKLAALLAKLDQEPSTANKKGWERTFNSPFIVTLLGGLLVTMITLAWQAQNSAIERERNRQIQLYDRKERLISDFAMNIVASLTYVVRFRQRDLWLAAQQHRTIKESFPDGRDFVQTRTYSEAMHDRFVTMPNPDALCSQIRVAFESASVRHKADELDEVMDNLVSAGTDADITQLFSRADALYQELLEAMELELKSDAVDGGSIR